MLTAASAAVRPDGRRTHNTPLQAIVPCFPQAQHHTETSSMLRQTLNTTMHDPSAQVESMQEEPHPSNIVNQSSSDASRISAPSSGTARPPGGDVVMPTSPARAIKKTPMERKHWSFSQIVIPTAMDAVRQGHGTGRSSNRAHYRHSSGNLGGPVTMVTRQASRFGCLNPEQPSLLLSTPPLNSTTARDGSDILPATLSHTGHSAPQTNSLRSLPILDSDLYATTHADQSSEQHSTSWQLPLIPSFADLNLRFEQSRTNSASSVPATNTILQGQDTFYVVEEQRGQQENISQTSVEPVVSPHMTNTDGNEISIKEQDYHWNPLTASDRSLSIALDMIPNLTPSIFDTVQSDDNETYIVWSTSPAPPFRKMSIPSPAISSTSVRPTTTTTTTTVTTAAVTAAALPPIAPSSSKSGANQPHSSITVLVISTSRQVSPSPLLEAEVPPPSPSQDRSVSQRCSAGESFKGKDTVHDSPGKQTQKDDAAVHATGSALTMNTSTSTSQARQRKAPTRTDSARESLNTNGSFNSAPLAPQTPTSSTLQASSTGSRVIMAATVEKLVEKLTSEIDYTFLTDFFLIFRLFVTPMALLNLFVLRFHWALIDNSPQRQIVRIRTFVTLRHWLLNYFGYDFMRSKDLRRTLNLHLRAIRVHPLVIDSPRDQRIVRELIRYSQSLKKIYYRNIAQQKLERQGRRPINRQRRSRHVASGEWSGLQVDASSNQQTSSSHRSSRIVNKDWNAKSEVSVAFTEELSVEFRSSDQSDIDDFDSEMEIESANDDNFELSSENSLYESEDDSDYSVPGVDEPDDDYSTTNEEDNDNQSDSGSEGISDNDDQVSLDEASLQEMPSSSHHRFSQHISQSVTGSSISKARPRGARSALPAFDGNDGVHGSYAASPDAPRFNYRYSVGGRRWSHAKSHSRPLSAFYPMSSSTSHNGLSRSTRASIRSIEPYINPPPRSITSTEKKRPWSKYMTATVGRLSKMTSVFSSGSRKGPRHLNSSTSMHSISSAGKRSCSGAVGQLRSSRYWHGNRSDPEGEKLSHYLLRSCTGMNMLVSSSEDRRLSSTDRRYASERDQQRDQAGSDWSSDDDYSQYEMTRRSSRQLTTQEYHEDYDAMDPQLLEMRLEQAQYPPYVDITPTILERLPPGEDWGPGVAVHELDATRKECPECERTGHHLYPSPLQTEVLELRRFGEGSAVEEISQVQDTWLASRLDASRRILQSSAPDLVSRIEDQQPASSGHRASWATSPSTCSSEFESAASNGNQLPHSQGLGPSDGQRHSSQHLPPPPPPLNSISRQKRQRGDLIDSGAIQSDLAIPPRAVTNQSKRHIISRVYEDHHTLHQASGCSGAEFQRRHSLDARSIERWRLGGQPSTPVRNDTSVEAAIHVRCHEGPSTSDADVLATDVLRQEDPTAASSDASGTRYTQVQPYSQPLTLVRPGFPKGRSKSQPHLFSSVRDPEAVALHVQPARPLRPPFTGAQTNTSCPHTPNSGLSARIQVISEVYVSHSEAQRLTSGRPGLGSRQTTQELLHPLDFVPSTPGGAAARVLPPILRYRSELIAQQLCLLECELLSQVQWYELVDAGWTKKQPSTAAPSSPFADSDKNTALASTAPNPASEASAGDHAHNNGEQKTTATKRNSNSSHSSSPSAAVSTADNEPAPKSTKKQDLRQEESVGIKKLVDRFNLTCQWVTSEIVSTQDLDMRVKVVEKFIRVAHTCYNHSNFSSLIQVMLGLQVHPVSRLSQTWARVRAQEMRIMHDLVEFTSPFHNWKHIRDAMKSIADEWGGGVGNSGSTASTPPNSGKSASAAAAGGSGGVAFFGKRTSKPKVATMTAKKSAATPGNSRRPSMVQPPMEMSATTTMSTQPSSYFSSHPFHHKGTLSTVAPTSPYSSVHNKDRDKERYPHDKEAAKPVQQGGCIPFLGLYLADLVFNTELPSYVEPSTFTPDSRPLVNIHKHRTTATIIKRVLTFRTLCGRYPFQPEPEVRDMLLAIQSLDSSELLQKSHVCEERATDAGQ